MPQLPIDAVMLRSHCAALSDDDALLEMFQRATVDWIEGEIHRTIVARTHQWILKDFPRCGDYAIHLPRGKTQSVESVQYSSNGIVTTLTGPSSTPPGTDYQENLIGDDGGMIMPLRGSSWPSVDWDVPAPVTINFTAGYREGAVPDQLQQAIMFTVSEMFEHRGSSDILTKAGGTNPSVFAVRSWLISPYRLERFY